MFAVSAFFGLCRAYSDMTVGFVIILFNVIHILAQALFFLEGSSGGLALVVFRDKTWLWESKNCLLSIFFILLNSLLCCGQKLLASGD